jgi:integration host factor subunit beta
MDKGGNMNKSGLIEALSKDTGLPIGKAEEVVKVFFDEMTNTLVSDDRVEVRGLCSMFVKQYEGYTGRNPKTGKLTEVKPKKLPFFKCGKELKERVDIQ